VIRSSTEVLLGQQVVRSRTAMRCCSGRGEGTSTQMCCFVEKLRVFVAADLGKATITAEKEP